MAQNGTNSIRVYHVDPHANHDGVRRYTQWYWFSCLISPEGNLRDIYIQKYEAGKSWQYPLISTDGCNGYLCFQGYLHLARSRYLQHHYSISCTDLDGCTVLGFHESHGFAPQVWKFGWFLDWKPFLADAGTSRLVNGCCMTTNQSRKSTIRGSDQGDNTRLLASHKVARKAEAASSSFSQKRCEQTPHYLFQSCCCVTL